MKAQEPSRTAPLSKEAQFYNFHRVSEKSSRWNSGACLYDYHSFHYHFLYIACYLRRTGNKIETFATVWARGVTQLFFQNDWGFSKNSFSESKCWQAHPKFKLSANFSEYFTWDEQIPDWHLIKTPVRTIAYMDISKVLKSDDTNKILLNVNITPSNV